MAKNIRPTFPANRNLSMPSSNTAEGVTSGNTTTNEQTRENLESLHNISCKKDTILVCGFIY